jgi:hypothetical protein
MEVEQARQCNRATVSLSPQTGQRVNIVLIRSLDPSCSPYLIEVFQKVNVSFDFMKVGIDFSHSLGRAFWQGHEGSVPSLGQRLGLQAMSREGTMTNASSSGSGLCALG